MFKYTVNNQTFISTVEKDAYHLGENHSELGPLYDECTPSIVDHIHEIAKYCPELQAEKLDNKTDGVLQYEASVNLEESKYHLLATVLPLNNKKVEGLKGYFSAVVVECVSDDLEDNGWTSSCVSVYPTDSITDDTIKEGMLDLAIHIWDKYFEYNHSQEYQEEEKAERNANIQATFTAVNTPVNYMFGEELQNA